MFTESGNAARGEENLSITISNPPERMAAVLPCLKVCDGFSLLSSAQTLSVSALGLEQVKFSAGQ